MSATAGVPGTGISVIVCHIREETPDARAVLVLHEYVSVIAIPADSNENDGDASKPEEPARRHTRWIVVHAADGDIAGQVKPALNCLLKAERVAADPSCGHALLLKVGRQCQRLVPADIAFGRRTAG